MNNDLSIDTLFKIAYDTNTPLSVMIELLTECNFRCKHCYIPEHKDMGLDTEVIKNLLYDLRKIGTLNISFTGGEIFLRRDIFEIIETARQLYFRVFLLSNASLLNEEKIKKLASLHISEFSTSVFSLDSSIHDSITGIPGSLKLTLKNIMLMKAYKIPVKIKTPLMKDNKYSYKELYKYCKRNGFEYLASPIIFSKSDGDKTTHLLRIDESDLISIVPDIDTISKKRKHLYNYDQPCAAICYGFSLDCKGDVYPCNSLYYKIGNIFEKSVSYIWDESQALKDIKKITKKDLHKCIECSLVDICERCPGLALLEDNDLCGCSTAARSIAIARYKIYKKKGGLSNGI